jgi:hypothetical protein
VRRGRRGIRGKNPPEDAQQYPYFFALLYIRWVLYNLPSFILIFFATLYFVNL